MRCFYQKSKYIRILLKFWICFSLFIMIGTPSFSNSEDSKGASIYYDICASCHEDGLKNWRTGAPNIDSVKDWDLYTKKGLEAMLNNTMEGTEGMGKKGECKKCSRAEVKATIEFMLTIIGD